MSEPQAFEVSLEAFSGPMDLLCTLAESRQIDTARIPLSQLLSQYISYLLDNDRVSLRELAEFFSFASRLIMYKLRALLPSSDGDENADEHWEDMEEPLEEALERYRPVRAAAAWLFYRQQERERHFVRSDDDEGPPWFDVGDLYSLARVWWLLLEKYSHTRGAYEEPYGGVSDAVPEGQLVESRMDELCAMMTSENDISLKELVGFGKRSLLVVTLLALLELSRLGKITMRQESCFGDVIFSLR